jgi:hypothetical protein
MRTLRLMLALMSPGGMILGIGWSVANLSRFNATWAATAVAMFWIGVMGFAVSEFAEPPSVVPVRPQRPGPEEFDRDWP